MLFNSLLILPGRYLIFLKLNANTIAEIPAKVKDSPVRVTSDNPAKNGFASKRKENIIPKTLIKARFPQPGIPTSFKSKENPNN